LGIGKPGELSLTAQEFVRERCLVVTPPHSHPRATRLPRNMHTLLLLLGVMSMWVHVGYRAMEGEKMV